MKKLLLLLIVFVSFAIAEDPFQVLLARESWDGITIVLKEKYGQTKVINNVNLVIVRHNMIYVSVFGLLYGMYPTCNYSYEVKK